MGNRCAGHPIKYWLVAFLAGILVFKPVAVLAVKVTKQDGGRTRVVLIGNSNYEYFDDVPGARLNVEFMQFALQHRGVKKGADLEVLFDATFEDFEQLMKRLRLTGSRNDVLLFYFSGLVKKEESTTYLLPVEADRRAIFENRVVDLNDTMKSLASIFKNSVFLFDTNAVPQPAPLSINYEKPKLEFDLEINRDSIVGFVAVDGASQEDSPKNGPSPYTIELGVGLLKADQVSVANWAKRSGEIIESEDSKDIFKGFSDTIPEPLILQSGSEGPVEVAYSNGIPDDQLPIKMLRARIESNYAFSVPYYFEQGSPEVAKMIISQDRSIDELIDILGGKGVRLQGSVKLTPSVEVSVTSSDPEGLTVTPRTDVEQVLLAEQENYWAWQVIGKRSGEYLLSVVVTLVGKGGDQARRGSPIAISRKVVVRVSEGQSGIVAEMRQESAKPDTASATAEMQSPPANSRVYWWLVVAGILLATVLVVATVVAIFRKRFPDSSKEMSQLPTVPQSDGAIFVSYSRKDSGKVSAITDLLVKEGYQLWVDRESIHGASAWRGEIVDAILHAKAVLFFVSEHSFRSENVEKEVALAAERKKKIIPIYLDRSDPSGSLYYHIAGLQRIEGTNGRPQAVVEQLAPVLDGLRDG